MTMLLGDKVTPLLMDAGVLEGGRHGEDDCFVTR